MSRASRFSHPAPVTVFSEAVQSDTSELASQSVPMVSTSTPGLLVPGAGGTGEERDSVFLEPDADRWMKDAPRSIATFTLSLISEMHVNLWKFCCLTRSDSSRRSLEQSQWLTVVAVVCRWRSSAEASLDPVVSQGDIEEPSQASDKAVVPSTSQEPSSSSAGMPSISAVGDSGVFCLFPSPFFRNLIHVKIHFKQVPLICQKIASTALYFEIYKPVSYAISHT